MAPASPSSSESSGLSSPPASDDELDGFEPKCHPQSPQLEETPAPKPSEEEVIVVASANEPEEPQVRESITVAEHKIPAAVSAKAITPPPLQITAVHCNESPPPAEVASDILPVVVEATDLSSDVAGPPSSSCFSSRPKRKREVKVHGPTTATAPAAKKGLAPAAKRRKKQWEPPFVYTSPNSPLVKQNIDLRAMLCNPLAWDGLSPAQQQSLIPLFPPGFVLDKGTPQARPNTQAMLNSDDFRHDCAQYLTNIRLGRHEPEWILQAQEAHLKRKNGDFDDFLRKKFRDDWGAEPPEGYPEPERVAALRAYKEEDETEDRAKKMVDEKVEIEKAGDEDQGRNRKAEVADEPLKLPPQETKQEKQTQEISLDQKIGQPKGCGTTKVSA